MPAQGQFPLVEGARGGGGGLEACVSSVQPGLVDGEHLVRVAKTRAAIKLKQR